MTEPSAPPPSGSTRPGRRSTRPGRRRGNPLAITAIVGGLLIVVATFLPWVSADIDHRVQIGDANIDFAFEGEGDSGWDMFNNQRDFDEDAFYVDGPLPFGQDRPVFTGLATLIAGLLVVVVGLLALLGPSPVTSFLGIFAGLLVVVVCFTNLVSALRNTRDLFGIDYGLIVLWVGAVLAAAIVPATLRSSTQRRRP